MFRFLSKVSSFVQRARTIAAAISQIVNVVMQICEFAESLLAKTQQESLGQAV